MNRKILHPGSSSQALQSQEYMPASAISAYDRTSKQIDLSLEVEIRSSLKNPSGVTVLTTLWRSLVSTLARMEIIQWQWKN